MDGGKERGEWDIGGFGVWTRTDFRISLEGTYQLTPHKPSLGSTQPQKRPRHQLLPATRTRSLKEETRIAELAQPMPLLDCQG